MPRRLPARGADAQVAQPSAGRSGLILALDHLTLGRIALYAAILGGRDGAVRRPLAVRARDPAARSAQTGSLQPDVPTSDEFDTARRELKAAVDGLRRAGEQPYLPLGLLTRAWLRFLTSARTGADSAQADLDEAWEIAERGPMKLLIADTHLHRARLFGRETLYPWESTHADLADARRLIEKCGYWRRKEELEDAEAGLRQQHSRI